MIAATPALSSPPRQGVAARRDDVVAPTFAANAGIDAGSSTVPPRGSSMTPPS